MAANRKKNYLQVLKDEEQKAQAVVSKARTEKQARLKQAKEEAEKEIAIFRTQMEADFQKKIAENSGDSGANVKRLEQETDAKITHLKGEASRISPDVVSMLLSVGKAVAAPVDSKRKTDKAVEDATEITCAPEKETGTGNANPTPFGQVTSFKYLETQTVTSTREVRFESPPRDNNNAEEKLNENVDFSEEVNATPVHYEGDDEEDSTLFGNEEDDDHPGQASIPKKIWTFFTT